MDSGKLRHRKIKDLTNKVFGRWTVVSYSDMDQYRASFWLCRCICGNLKRVRGSGLIRGDSKSCGCLKKELSQERLKGYGGPNHYAWKGGESKRGGYIRLRLPIHSNADKNGLVSEHIKIMSEILGRPLLPGETVHHKNGLRDDNRPENLELRLNNHHPKGQLVGKDLIPYWIEMLMRYAPEKLIGDIVHE